jgi:hypothetical protein
LGLYPGSFYAGGIFLGYIVYDLVHWSNHVHAPKTAYGRWARRHHFSHHFSDARFNHGVTTPIWDVVFRTYRAPGRIVVPKRLCMDWLLDSETGCIRHQFRNDFELRQSKGRRKSAESHRHVPSNLNLDVGAHIVVETA